MNADTQTMSPSVPGRVTSIDFFRGFTMFLLAGEATQLYGHFNKFDSGIMQFLGTSV